VNQNSGGTLISGAASSSYTPLTADAGTVYYYAVVINANDNVNGVQTASVASSTVEIVVNAPPVTYAIGFYDENLSFIESVSLQEGNINPSNIKSGSWYKKGENTPLVFFYLDSDINLYAIANVKEIITQEDLNNVRTDLSGKYILLNDIELNATDGAAGFDSGGWQNIGSSINVCFSGLFNGNNHTISNLQINRTTDYVGLFGIIRGANVKNIRVWGNIKGAGYVGGITGRVHSSNLTNAYFKGNVVGTSSGVGGIAGYNTDGGTVSHSFSEGTVSGAGSVGGIVGYNSASIERSHSSANLSGTTNVGGIVGYHISSAIIKNSYFAGNVNASGENVGGIAGRSQDSAVENSYSTGNVSSTSQNVGGIIGYNYTYSSIKNSYSAGTISGTNRIGGIAGYTNGARNVTNTYSTAIVIGSGNNVGGITGYISNISPVSNNVALNPSINGTSAVSRIGSFASGTLSNNFASDDVLVNGSTVTGDDGSGVNGIDKTIAELKTETTYSDSITNGGLGWSFGNDDENPWKIDLNKNDGLPYLYWQEL
jgi:hypothetical protein